ncbi:hypothetical protein DSUL_80024 [Desulfovibrionales bacterium]
MHGKHCSLLIHSTGNSKLKAGSLTQNSLVLAPLASFTLISRDSIYDGVNIPAFIALLDTITFFVIVVSGISPFVDV